MSNYGDVSYVQFKVDKNIIKRLDGFLCKLVDQVWDFNFEETVTHDNSVTKDKFFDPKTWIDKHFHYENKEFDIHVIIGKDKIHLIIKHSKKTKDKLIKVIEDKCEWVKPKPIKNKKNKHITNKK